MQMKKNILVVDDSALMRRVTSDIINADERFCVTDFAKNGFEAVDMILKNYGKYAAVVLDINEETGLANSIERILITPDGTYGM